MVAKKPVICPSLTFGTAAEYSSYMDTVATFAGRLHIDVTDGILTPSRSIGLAQIWWPKGKIADIHLMYRRPLEYVEALVSLGPSLVVVHPEAEGDLGAFAAHLKKFKIRFGIALMPGVALASLNNLLDVADHALIFSGTLGSYGGHANPARFEDVRALRRHYPNIEIGWDGGANASNVHAIARAGVDTITVGGGLSKSGDPEAAYAKMMSELEDL